MKITRWTVENAMQHFCQMLEALQRHHLGFDSNMIDEIRCSSEASSWPRQK
jgi:hypothetical protein